jgi:DNA-binding response OmpR family regulator
MQLLLIEDDVMIGQSLVRGLKDSGLAVDWAQDGNQGQALCETGRYDLILLDLGLPDKSGFEVLESMRARGNRTALIIITARDEIDDRVKGLEFGADDYLIKPFGFKELMARIKGILRQYDVSFTSTMSNGEITIDSKTHSVTYRGKSMVMPSKELSLLCALTEHPGVIFSRSQIEKHLYGWNEKIESNVVEVLIHSIRRKFDNQIIRNVRGIGWMVAKHPS